MDKITAHAACQWLSGGCLPTAWVFNGLVMYAFWIKALTKHDCPVCVALYSR